MFNPLQFTAEFGKADPAARLPSTKPLRILFINDLGDSCASRTEHSLATRPLRAVDIDTFDTFMSTEKPAIDLDEEGFTLKDLDDVHPDQIWQNLSSFQTLKDLKNRVRDPAQFDSVAQNVQAMLQTSDVPSAPPAEPETDTDTVSRPLGAQPTTQSVSTPPPTDYLTAILHDAVAAHITPEADPRAAHYRAALDDAAAAHMRAVLHNPKVQSVEAAWRGLHLLVSNIDTDTDMSIHVLNASKTELIAALAAPDGAVDNSVLHSRLVEEPAHAPFTLMVLGDTVAPTPEEVRLLASLGAFAGRTGAVVLASPEAGMIGVPSWDAVALSPAPATPIDDWTLLRSTPMANHIVALAPRFMIRTPYGKKLDPIEAFPFEEIVSPARDHDAFLWGASSLLACILIACSFEQDGWSARLNTNLAYGDLPFVPYDADGEQQMKPGAETLLSDRAAAVLQDAGIVPVSAIRNQNIIRLPWFQTLATGGDDGRIGPFAL
ncbi:type VI secretion system contractile sheath domain-containing protein [Marivita sp. S0852]|uniref:type VI secretion system contractile sheath domain-containing protein n=1 Tax=Marivita sp. S0852 TaxID=3373893 RepID=UPI00398215C0